MRGPYRFINPPGLWDRGPRLWLVKVQGAATQAMDTDPNSDLPRTACGLQLRVMALPSLSSVQSASALPIYRARHHDCLAWHLLFILILPLLVPSLNLTADGSTRGPRR